MPSIGLGAVASLLEVSAISEIIASSSKLSFPVANLTIVRRWTWMFVKSMLLTFVNIKCLGSYVVALHGWQSIYIRCH